MKYFPLILTVVCFSCTKHTIEKGNIREDQAFINELNSKANDTLLIDSNRLVLDAFIWRDFMPISPEDGQPMISLNTLRDIDSNAIPNHLSLIQQYVIHGNWIWVAEYENQEFGTTENFKLEKISRNGPKWGPNIEVDVIVNILDTRTDTEYFISLRNSLIYRTD